MAKVLSVEPIPGVTDLFSLLTFLTDPDKYEVQLKKLEDLRKAANLEISRVGKSEEIEALALKAKLAHDDSVAALDRARLAAGLLVSEAKAEAAALSDAANKDRWDKAAKLDTRSQALAAQEQAVAEAEKAVARVTEQANADRHALEAAHRAVDILKAEYEAKVAKVRAAGL